MNENSINDASLTGYWVKWAQVIDQILLYQRRLLFGRNGLQYNFIQIDGVESEVANYSTLNNRLFLKIKSMPTTLQLQFRSRDWLILIR